MEKSEDKKMYRIVNLQSVIGHLKTQEAMKTKGSV